MKLKTCFALLLCAIAAFSCTSDKIESPVEGTYSGTNTFVWPEDIPIPDKQPGMHDMSSIVVMVIKDHQFAEDRNSGTCTIVVPVANPFDLPGVKVSFESGVYHFSHEPFELGGYKNEKGLTGTLDEHGHIVLKYDAWPNGMKRSFDFTFEGNLQK